MVNPVKVIGRYQFPILAVSTVVARQGLRTWLQRRAWFQRWEWAQRQQWLKPVYDVRMTDGQILRLSSEEKARLDYEREKHETILKVWGMAKSAGLRA